MFWIRIYMYLDTLIFSYIVCGVTLFGRNTDKQIYISTMDQYADTNRTRMKHLLLLATNIGSKDLVIFIARLGENLVSGANQLKAYIYIRGQGDWYFPFGSWKSGNKMSVDFGQNEDY